MGRSVLEWLTVRPMVIGGLALELSGISGSGDLVTGAREGWHKKNCQPSGNWSYSDQDKTINQSINLC